MQRLTQLLPESSPRGDAVDFTVDGRAVRGFTHESVAGAVLAAGRSALSRSLRFHRPRTMFCSTGECGWCAMEVDGRPNVPTCTLACRPGLRVRSQNAWPSAHWDLFGLLDLASPWLPYTFYHHRFLRPRVLRQWYLRGLRFFTGAARLTPGRAPAASAPPRRWESVETQVAVVGAGPAGLSAALAAAEAGAEVVVLDHGGPAARDEAWQALAQRAARQPRLIHWPQSTALGLYAPNTLGVLTPERLVKLRARQIILAPGALDALPLFANNDLPGVISARLVERLLLREGLRPGTRAVLWGSPALAERAQRLMDAAGIAVAAQLSAADVLLAARGPGRVRAAVIRQSTGRTMTVPCDLIVIAALQPRNELLAQAGGPTRWDEAAGGLAAVRDRYLQTTLPGVYVAGEAAGPAEAARCVAEGRLAGLAAAQALGARVAAECEALADHLALWPRAAQPSFPARSPAGAAHVCYCEDVREREIRADAGHGYDTPELVKRRTAVVTGPCQGKFCLMNALRVRGQTGEAPTARPPARPVRLGDLAVD